MRGRRQPGRPRAERPGVAELRGSLVLYAAAAVLAFAPGLFTGRSLFEGDLINLNVPYWDFLRGCLSRGQWPLWCPFLFAGQPFLADPNTMMWYPPAYLFLLPSWVWGMGLFGAFHLFMVLVGAHLWLRSAGFSPFARRVGALTFGLSGFFWLEAVHPQVVAGYAWLPWWGLALDRLAQTGERRWAFAAGASFALMFLSGHFQVPLGAIYGGGAYFCFRSWAAARAGGGVPVDWK
ncbi:MAG TPA: hypothetical protein VFR02_04350, partial [bacterium]|nr:hypothetical protein [bacterium]